MLRRILQRGVVDMKFRETKAKLETDPFDHPAYDTESTKQNTGDAIQVEIWPRRKLKELYVYTLEYLKDLPEDAGYRIIVEELTRFRLKVVESTEDHSEIEQKIGYGYMEELIEAAKNEITLIGIMKHEKPWEPRQLDEMDFKLSEVMPGNPFGEWKTTFNEEKPTRK